MEAVKTIFINSIRENAQSSDISSIICDLVFDISLKKLQNLSNEDSIQTRLEHLFKLFTEALDEEGAKSAKSIAAVIDGLIRAASYDKKQYLLKTMYEREQIEASLRRQSNELTALIANTYDTIENAAKSMSGEDKTQINQGLIDAKLLNIEVLGILKEVVEEAFIATIEQAGDIQDTIKEISKNVTYQAINEGKFTKARIIDIASVIIQAACDIADSDYANATDILNGAVKGTKKGIAKAVTKFKNELRFAPEEVKEFVEQEALESQKAIINTEEAFIAMLKRCQTNSDGISSKILFGIITEHSTYIAKLKRLSAEAAGAWSAKIENFKDEGLKDFREKAGKKFEEIKKGTNEKVAAFKTDAVPKAKQMAGDAKNLGFRAWEATKTMLDDVVKNAKDRKKK
ncbi:MAG: hypothetical protein LBS73_01145 [Campylobacteraceae bacterium]|jgi:hypothetical protein|nr:hypothetical protein [Campylobacteraceae bacterium]